MTKDDINTLILFSFRYVIGLKTSAFEDVAHIIKRSKLPEWMVKQLIRDCERVIAMKEINLICEENIIECEKLLVFLRGSESAKKAD